MKNALHFFVMLMFVFSISEAFAGGKGAALSKALKGAEGTYTLKPHCNAPPTVEIKWDGSSLSVAGEGAQNPKSFRNVDGKYFRETGDVGVSHDERTVSNVEEGGSVALYRQKRDCYGLIFSTCTAWRIDSTLKISQNYHEIQILDDVLGTDFSDFPKGEVCSYVRSSSHE